MRDPLPPLPGIQAFEAAARHSSFAAAAAELHLSAAAVSQRIRALEAHLGVPLFERLARSVRLTALGRAYLPAVRESLDDLGAATSGLFAPARRDQLTVRTQVSYATTWLGPRLPQFQAVHPEIDLRIVCAVWSEALVLGEVDLDIHQGRGAWAGAHTRLLHRDSAVVVHGPGHVERWGPITTGADLAVRPRIRIMGFDDVWQTILPHDLPATGRTITVDLTTVALELAATGDACAVVPERFARTAVRTGRVVLALAQAFPMRQAPICCARSTSRRRRPRLAPSSPGWTGSTRSTRHCCDRIAAAKHRDLMTQHPQLDILGGGRSAHQQDQAEHLQEDQIQQPQRHGCDHAQPLGRRSPLVSGRGRNRATGPPPESPTALPGPPAAEDADGATEQPGVTWSLPGGRRSCSAGSCRSRCRPPPCSICAAGRTRSSNGSRRVWVLLSFVNFIGPIAYFLAGSRTIGIRVRRSQ